MNGYLAIGGSADGQYHNADHVLKHGETVRLRPRVLAPTAWKATFVDEPVEFTTETYKAWEWHQGNDRRVRLYLIPLGWDGFEAMDHLERKAYAGLED